MRARLRSYGETSTRTRSPGRIRMRNRRIFPATWPSTSWPLSSCTRNIAFGSASTTSPSNSTFSSLATDQMVRTLVACGPLPVSPSSYSTFAPSTSVRKPSPAMPEKWTKASFPPSSGVMKPKPFSSLNHLTTPVAIQHLLTAGPMREVVVPGTAFPHASTTTAPMRPWNVRVYTSERCAGPDQGGVPCPSDGEAPDGDWYCDGSKPPEEGVLGSAGVCDCGAACVWVCACVSVCGAAVVSVGSAGVVGATGVVVVLSGVVSSGPPIGAPPEFAYLP